MEVQLIGVIPKCHLSARWIQDLVGWSTPQGGPENLEKTKGVLFRRNCICGENYGVFLMAKGSRDQVCKDLLYVDSPLGRGRT